MFWRGPIEDDEQDIIIIDGMVQTAKSQKYGLKTDENEPENPPNSTPAPDIPPGLYLIENEEIPYRSGPNTAYRKHLPEKAVTSYIEDDNLDDLDLFLLWLKDEGRSSRYIYETKLNLRKWKAALDGQIDNPVQIQRTINENPARARLLFSALKKYGKYRNLMGDPRLLIVLAAADFTFPAYKPNPKTLSRNEIRMIRSTARDLCLEADRVGIWMGLSMIGIKPSEVKGLEYSSNGKSAVKIQRGGRMVKLDAPDWLTRAMHNIPDESWRLGRHSIHRGVLEYGTNSQTIYRSVSAGNTLHPH